MSVDQSLTASVVSGVYKNISLESRHLGSLLFLTRKKSTDFNFPKEKPESRYSIKSLAQAVYTMSTLIFLNWVWNGMWIYWGRGFGGNHLGLSRAIWLWKLGVSWPLKVKLVSRLMFGDDRSDLCGIKLEHEISCVS